MVILQPLTRITTLRCSCFTELRAPLEAWIGGNIGGCHSLLNNIGGAENSYVFQVDQYVTEWYFSGPSSGQFPKISGIAVNQPQPSYQWGINNSKITTRKTKPRRIGWLFFFHEVGTAIWPREFYHGNYKVGKFPWPYRGSYFVKKQKHRHSMPVGIPRFLLRKKNTPSFDSPWFGIFVGVFAIVYS